MLLFAKLQIITFPLSALPINREDGFPFQMVIPLINIRVENFFGLKRCPQSFRLVWLMGWEHLQRRSL